MVRMVQVGRLGEHHMDGKSELDAYIAEVKRRGFKGEIMVKQACETVRSSYYESTIRCVNHTEGCDSVLLVCGEDALSQKVTECMVSAGWHWYYSGEARGAICPECLSPECGNDAENCWCNEASYEVEDQ